MSSHFSAENVCRCVFARTELKENEVKRGWNEITLKLITRFYQDVSHRRLAQQLFSFIALLYLHPSCTGSSCWTSSGGVRPHFLSVSPPDGVMFRPLTNWGEASFLCFPCSNHQEVLQMDLGTD